MAEPVKTQTSSPLIDAQNNEKELPLSDVSKRTIEDAQLTNQASIMDKVTALKKRFITWISGIPSWLSTFFQKNAAQNIATPTPPEPQKETSPEWTDKTKGFLLTLLKHMNPAAEGLFRTGGRDNEAKELVKTESSISINKKTDSKLLTSAFKKSLAKRPLFSKGKSKEKTDKFFNTDGKLKKDVNPEQIYKALVKDLSGEQKVVFDALIAKFAQMQKPDNLKTNKMNTDNLAIGFGPSLFPEENVPLTELHATMEKNLERNKVLIAQLVEYANQEHKIEKPFENEKLEELHELEKEQDRPLKEIDPNTIFERLTQGLTETEIAQFENQIDKILIQMQTHPEFVESLERKERNPNSRITTTPLLHITTAEKLFFSADIKGYENSDRSIQKSQQEILNTNRILLEKMIERKLGL